MLNLLMENYLWWLVIGGAAFATGYAVAIGTNKRAFIFGGIGAALLALALGAVLVFFVQTDRKGIRHTVEALEQSARDNDADGMKAYVAKDKSGAIEKLIDRSFKAYEIKRAKVTDFKIVEINKSTSPPRAVATFRGSATAVTRSGGYEGTGMAKFEVVFRKEQDGVWRITDETEVDLILGPQ